MDWIKNHPRISIGTVAAIHALVFMRHAFPQLPISRLEKDVSLFLLLIFSQEGLMLLGFSQGVLLSIWAVLTRKKIPLRVTSVFAALVACLWINQGSMMRDYRCDVLIGFSDIGAFLLIARLSGLELNNIVMDISTPNKRDHQYSLWQIMVWTTSFAVLLSAANYLPKYFYETYYYHGKINIISHAIISIAALAALWLALGRASIFIRMTLAATAIGLATTTAKYVWPAPLSVHLLLLIFESLVIFSTLSVVRLAGYRLTWQWRFQRPKQELSQRF